MPVQPKVSAESALLSALDKNNPFERPPIVTEQNIWGESFPDIPSINKKASDSLFDAVRKVKASDSSLEKVTSLVFVSDRGVGKSHVIKRIRRRLQATSEGVFIYASADKYINLSAINSLFQQSVAESLEQMGGENVTQWQEIATLMVAEALRDSKPSATVPSAPDLVAKFDQIYHARREQNIDLVSHLAKVIRKLKPSADPYVLRAIVWTLSEERSFLAVKWLAGEQLSVQDAAELRLPTRDQSEREANDSAFKRLLEIFSLIGEYRTAIVCFDELDTKAADENGYPAEYVVLNLVKQLFDSISQSRQAKGVVIVTALLPSTWRRVKQNEQASLERVSAYSEPIDLEFMNAESVKELCELTLEKFYKKKDLIPPSPIYPLSGEEISAFGKGRPQARETLKWFAKRINEIVGEVGDDSLSPTERFEKAYVNALDQFNLEDIDNNELSASALKFGFEKIASLSGLQGQQIGGVVVKGVEEVIPKSKNNGWLQFKVVGEENGEPVIIGVEVMQQTHGLSVGAGFRRLIDIETFELSRGCLVRSLDRKVKRYWDSYEHYQQLIADGGEWVNLTFDHIKPLFALQYVYEFHEKFDLTHRRLDSLAFTRNLLKNNPLIKEILSRPEGQVAEEALEGEEFQRSDDEINLENAEIDLDLSLKDELTDEVEVKFEMQEIVEALSA